VNLTVGNIRPKETVTVFLEIVCGVELRDDGFRFRFPFTLAPAYHSRARTAVTDAGDGEMELPAAEFGDMLLPRFREDASALHQIGFELAIAAQLRFDEIGSPSHAVRVKQDGAGAARIALAAAKDVPNRDLVLDARFQSIEPQVLTGNRRCAAIVPSSSFGAATEAPRRVVILLDRSGSMQGEPLAQARQAITACLAVLSETDSFGLVAFDNQVLAFQPVLVSGAREWRDRAHEFLMQVEARGGTELSLGFLEAAKLLGGQGGDILILTDGQVSGTEKILADARSAGVRLHCLGIGSASQDRFLALLARETGGVSRFVTPRERVDLSAVDLFASVGRPVACGLKAGTNVQPAPPSFVFSGTPVLVFGDCGETGDTRIELTWEGGRLELPVKPAEHDCGETIWLLQGARLITDWESRYPATEALAPLEKRQQSRIAARLLELSRTYGLASREMSLVAVVTRQGDRPGELPETRVVPVGMPQDTPFRAYFPGKVRIGAKRASPDSRHIFATVLAKTPSLHQPPFTPVVEGAASSPFAAAKDLEVGSAAWPKRIFAQLFGASRTEPVSQNAESILLDLCSRMEPDGGMPGRSPEDRAGATIVALLAFLSQGHTLTAGAFRAHVTRLVAFLTSLSGVSGGRRPMVAEVIALARKGQTFAGEWISLAREPGSHWKEIETGLRNR
jgi:Ca-activated chloride channel family protein